MRKLFNFLATILLLCLVGLSACVTKGKFLASQAWVQQLETDSANTHKLLSDCNINLGNTTSELNTCNGKLADCNGQVNQLGDDKAGLEAKNKSLKNDLDILSSTSNSTISAQAKKLKDLEDLLQSQRDIMNRLRKKIADALVNFKPDELTVHVKDGNVYVSLSEKLLFKSGSAVVDPKGKQALGTLAVVLNQTPDVNVNIEGHTDTVPIHNEHFDDNWALSTGRAISIVRILTKDYGVDAHRIIASGRGEFHPLLSNDTPEGKTANRRTEIILSPNLSELYKLLGQ